MSLVTYQCASLGRVWDGCVQDRDDKKRVVYGVLDNEPVNDYEGRIEVGSELAISFSQVREHRKPTAYTKQ